jgi:hypothetical protein
MRIKIRYRDKEFVRKCHIFNNIFRIKDYDRTIMSGRQKCRIHAVSVVTDEKMWDTVLYRC